ncbi:hypothetical protein Taro_000907 [Colocasia esculenta]|uniref:Uncharacterized protein n=1 Tax=Colocasia esculenta TaxID=4460 RepID=A0A843T8I7_COLES|nr:hypothetical protein [Colocasia esculenta]
MGSSQSSQLREEEEEEEEDEEEEEEGEERELPKIAKKKVLEQEPEILPCRASASPLSPQLSAVGTPRLIGGPAIKVWDPCNVLALPPVFARGFGSADVFGDGGDRVTKVFLISHEECSLGLCPDLVGGRWPAAGLMGNGESDEKYHTREEGTKEYAQE